ncbi:hypothetical protein BJ322DRAFT_1067422 [Thelephora terrestris]|uniref:Uncharacterized protein n=1 Tax=Thelephora terrestris TaxID=56493 RepID=A0A9P6L5R3_9AGAM|nr:hypothetical protein BJ322DRAFT_1067422 [Thelephora terrestris]
MRYICEGASRKRGVVRLVVLLVIRELGFTVWLCVPRTYRERGGYQERRCVVLQIGTLGDASNLCFEPECRGGAKLDYPCHFRPQERLIQGPRLCLTEQGEDEDVISSLRSSYTAPISGLTQIRTYRARLTGLASRLCGVQGVSYIIWADDQGNLEP